jgi:hypothetical protein
LDDLHLFSLQFQSSPNFLRKPPPVLPAPAESFSCRPRIYARLGQFPEEFLRTIGLNGALLKVKALKCHVSTEKLN